MSAPTVSADLPRPPDTEGTTAPADREAPRQLYTAGGIAAASAAAIGLATLMTLTLIGWVAAPHASFGEDIPDVFRLAVQMWLVGHHVGVAIPGGQLSMLPLGLVLVPGMLLYRTGRWLARSCELPRVRDVFRAALAIAGPYAAIAGTLALLAHTETVQPSMPQALIAGFALAYIAGGLGVLRQLLVDKDIARRRLLRLIPPRPRSLLTGSYAATVVLLAAGLALFLVGLGVNFGEAVAVTQQLRPGVVGGVLLILLQLLYLPNAVIFGTSYAAGPGFAVGAETIVAPTGISLGALPALPMLAALPESGPAPVLSLAALAAPFVAGGVGGWVTLRSAPSVVSEAAPMWGFACGVCTGVVWAALALLAGGSMGAERMAQFGPPVWQVGLVVALEVGVAAAIVGWLANWLYFRRAIKAGQVTVVEEAAAGAQDGADTTADTTAEEEPAAPAEAAEATEEQAAEEPERPKRRLRLPWPRKQKKEKEDEGDDTGLVFGVSYEAGTDAEQPETGQGEAPPDAAAERSRKSVVFDEGATVTYLGDRARRKERERGRERGT